MLRSQTEEGYDEYVAELLKFSSKATQQKLQTRQQLQQSADEHTLSRPAGLPEYSDSIATSTLQAAYLIALDTHADPVAPLRYRDLAALDEMFGDIQVSEIEADILQHLSWMYPEPCWDDDPYEFLHGYI
ncbi:MAG: hypothetical protein F6K04_05820 [Leptolyngbya sp. SIO4C5]|uniref:hypothetical protein n=1 Tax=Sphaerothrix gracilis TaxID=3151835 RepID=UPI0013BF9EDC|nr:hypothetical protein [Leptolyngbya sp. SIO4C5]